MSTLERAIVDELVVQSAARAVADQLLLGATDRIGQLNERLFTNEVLEEKLGSLSDQVNAARPKITEMYKSAQELVIELGRRKLSSAHVVKARMKLAEACREAYPHIDVAGF